MSGPNSRHKNLTRPWANWIVQVKVSNNDNTNDLLSNIVDKGKWKSERICAFVYCLFGQRQWVVKNEVAICEKIITIEPKTCSPALRHQFPPRRHGVFDLIGIHYPPLSPFEGLICVWLLFLSGTDLCVSDNVCTDSSHCYPNLLFYSILFLTTSWSFGTKWSLRNFVSW